MEGPKCTLPKSHKGRRAAILISIHNTKFDSRQTSPISTKHTMKRSRKQSAKGNNSPSSVYQIVKKKSVSKQSPEKQIVGKTKDLELPTSQVPNEVDCEVTKRLPLLPLCSFDSSSKIKLQLFPIDKCTQTELAKDGYHPYLELTLSARKKISSVLKHLSQKWGRSRIALGEPVLFPYSILQNLAGYRWTSNDCDTSAGDVYAAIGSPTIFRLRYGWSGIGCMTSGVPFKACSQSAFIESVSRANKENTFVKVEQTAVTGKEFVKSSTIIREESKTEKPEKKMSSNELVDPKIKERKMDTGMGPLPNAWADSFTNISIGGLLSEASLQGKFNQCDPKSNAALQPVEFISDSLDAFLAGQMNQSQGPMLQPKSDGFQLNADSFDAFIASQLNQRPCPKLPTFDTRSSILDAENTCHSFPLQKKPSSGKDASTFSRSPFSRICSQDGGSMTETNSSKSGILRGQCQESETDLQLCSRVYNDESSLSLGLSGNKWTDSLGSFDLGLSSSS